MEFLARVEPSNTFYRTAQKVIWAVPARLRIRMMRSYEFRLFDSERGLEPHW